MVDCAMFLEQQRYSRQEDQHRKDPDPYIEKEERYMEFGNDSTAGITNEDQATAGKGLPKVTVNASTI